jgi:membrane protease YdiL (CAAX protease family)
MKGAREPEDDETRKELLARAGKVAKTGKAGKSAKKPRRAKRAKKRGAGTPRATAIAPPIDYFRRTRALHVNLLFLAPWLLIYVVCWAWAGDAVETQAASWLRNGLRLLGSRALFVVTVVVALGLSAFVLARLKESRKDAGVFPLMAAEGALYGLLLYGAGTVLSRLLPVGRWIGLFGWDVTWGDVTTQVQALGTSIGAGIFEELVFRGVLCWAAFHVLRDVLGADRWSAGIVAIVASAALFSAYHHWGPGGEPWDAARFTFRMHAGALLGVVFLTRGLGIAAFAHGLYDALVLLG